MGRILVLALVLGSVGVAHAQRTCDPEKDKDCIAPRVVKVTKKAPPPRTPPTIDGGGISVIGKQHVSMISVFLERANEELERSALERRSFVPELVRSVDREAL